MAGRTASQGLHRRAPLEALEGPLELFGEDELRVLTEVQPMAEELVGEFFRLGAFGPPRHLYEIVTLASGGAECRAPGALARLCRFDREERPIGLDPRIVRFYRICLQDDNLLRRVGEGFDLRALLVYVLTHELIHIVRFESFAVIYDAGETERATEEREVDRLTREILTALREPAVDHVLRGLSPADLDVLAPAG